MKARRLKNLYLLVICVFLFAGAVAFGVKCWTAIHSPYELDYGEGAIMWQAQQVMHLSKAYHRIEQYPHMVFHYTPLYQLAAHGLALFTNDLLRAGRWVSFVSALGVGIIVGLLAFSAVQPFSSVFVRTSTALVSGLLCFNISTISWARLMRVDTLALLFTFGGLLLFAWAPRRRALHYLAFLFFALAGFTKQTQVAAPAACLLIAFILDQVHAVRLFAFAAVLAAAGLAALSVPTHGDALLNLFLYNRNPFSILNMLGIVQLNLSTVLPMAAIAFSVPATMAARLAQLPRARRSRIVRAWLENSQTRRVLAICSLHMLLAFAVSFTCGKRGSNYNYFLEWNLASCILVGPAIVFSLRRIGARTISASQLGILMLLLLFSTNGPAALAEELRTTSPSTNARDSERVMTFLRALPGPVYSENMTVLLRSGKDAVAEPSIITNLAQLHAWDEQPFVKQLASGFFSAVIVTTSLDNRNRFTPAVQAAIERAYTFQSSYGEFKIFLPRSLNPVIGRPGADVTCADTGRPASDPAASPVTRRCGW